MGFSHDSFYRYRAVLEEGGVEGLLERTRRKPNPKNPTAEATEAAVAAFALDYPAYGQVGAANELRKRGCSSGRAGCAVYGCAMDWSL